MRGPRPLDSFATVLAGLARRLGLETLLVEHRLQREWSAIAGEPLASHTWPDQIRYKKLYLRVRNSIWLHQLTFLKPALMQKLTAVTGADMITDVVLRVGELPRADSSPSSGSTPCIAAPVPDAALLADVSTHISSVHDPDLRDRLAQLMARSLAESSAQTAGRRTP